MGETSIGLWTGPQEFSCEMDCVRAFRDAYAQAGVPCPEMAIFSLPTNKELLFPPRDSACFPLRSILDIPS